MEQLKPTEALEVTEVAKDENPKPALTMEILITRMMQTQRNIEAYCKGEMTEAEFDALGITFF